MLSAVATKRNDNNSTGCGRKLWEVMLFMNLMTTTVSQAYSYPQTHRGADIKHVQFFTWQSYLNEMVLKTKIKVAGYHFERVGKRRKKKIKRIRNRRAWPLGHRSCLAGGCSSFCHDRALDLPGQRALPKATVKTRRLQDWTAWSVLSRGGHVS